MEHLYYWLTSIEDRELVNKAARMDLSLDDFPIPESHRDDQTPGHWYDTLRWTPIVRQPEPFSKV
jgi:hypothetical protein